MPLPPRTHTHRHKPFPFACFDPQEDAATAEISRSQLWQWVRHNSKTAEGTVITKEYVQKLLDEEVSALCVGNNALCSTVCFREEETQAERLCVCGG